MNRALEKKFSNMELLRIFAMLMIISYHIYYHCVVIQLTDANSIARLNNGLFNMPYFYKRLLILATIAPMGQIGNVIFITISGFFMVQKDKIDLTKISTKLLLQQGFAAILLTLGSTLFYKFTHGVFVNLIEANIFNNMSWYVGYYFLIIVFASLFLNNFLAKLDKTQYIKFLMVLLAVTQFSWIGEIINSFSSGFLTFFSGVFLYSFGGYIKKYNPFDKIKSITLIIIIIMVYLLIYLSSYNITENNIQAYYRNGNTDSFFQTIPWVADNYIIPIILGISIFELFRRIHMPNSKYINFIGTSTFMVYLLHDNTFFYGIWDTQDWITVLYNNPYYYIVKHILWTVMTFVVGVLAYVFYLLFNKLLKKYGYLFMKNK